MPSSEFRSDYLISTVSMSTDNETLAKTLDFINEFPEGSARRLEMEAHIFRFLADYVDSLAVAVRNTGRLTLHDSDD